MTIVKHFIIILIGILFVTTNYVSNIDTTMLLSRNFEQINQSITYSNHLIIGLLFILYGVLGIIFNKKGD